MVVIHVPCKSGRLPEQLGPWLSLALIGCAFHILCFGPFACSALCVWLVMEFCHTQCLLSLLIALGVGVWPPEGSLCRSVPHSRSLSFYPYGVGISPPEGTLCRSVPCSRSLSFCPFGVGIWPPERRNLADSDCWSWLRQSLFEKAARRAGSVEELKREFFRMAAGGEEGCRLVRDQHFIEELVDTLGSWIEAQDLAVPGLIDIAEGQPLRLKLIRASSKRLMTRIGISCYRPRSGFRWGSWRSYHILLTSLSHRRSGR